MDAHYTFEIDKARSLVRISMSGLFTLADIDAFFRDREKAHAALGCAPNQHLTLNDVTAMKIQHQEVVAAFRDMLAAPEHRSRRLAFVAGPTLARASSCVPSPAATRAASRTWRAPNAGCSPPKPDRRRAPPKTIFLHAPDRPSLARCGTSISEAPPMAPTP